MICLVKNVLHTFQNNKKTKNFTDYSRLHLKTGNTKNDGMSSGPKIISE